RSEAHIQRFRAVEAHGARPLRHGDGPHVLQARGREARWEDLGRVEGGSRQHLLLHAAGQRHGGRVARRGRREPVVVADGPGWTLERRLWARGAVAVAGVDEAGRGALAGPVAAAVVVLQAGRDYPYRDSKTL